MNDAIISDGEQVSIWLNGRETELYVYVFQYCHHFCTSCEEINRYKRICGDREYVKLCASFYFMVTDQEIAEILAIN